MHIEEQRWAPLPVSCTPALEGDIYIGAYSSAAGAFNWTLNFSGSDPSDPSNQWEEYFELTHKVLLFDVEFHWGGGPEAGCYLAKSCTEFASYPHAWATVGGLTGAEIASKLTAAFDGKGARILDLDLGAGFPDAPPEEELAGGMTAVIVPNQGPAARAWWWSGSAGATAGQVADVINGKAWSAGNFKHDNIKKKLVTVERSRWDGKFRFVLNESKPGEAWWWGFGASVANITSVLNGEAWADFKRDGIEKRLVSLRRHAKDNWTFLMLPRNGLGWWWYPKISFDELVSNAKANNARIIDLEEYGVSKADPSMEFSAVLVQNSPSR